MDPTPPRVMTIAGTDSGGGAGVAADLRAMTACGVHGCVAVTAVTVQNSLGVTGVHTLPPETVAAQIEAVATDIGLDAAKTGMLATSAIIRAIAEACDRVGIGADGADPVRRRPGRRVRCTATSCWPTTRSTRSARCCSRARRCSPRTSTRCACSSASTSTTAAASTRRPSSCTPSGPRFVLVKGGHLREDTDICVDVLYDGHTFTELPGPRFATPTPTAAATTWRRPSPRRSRGAWPLPEAVAFGKRFVVEAVRHSYALGAGHGPVSRCGPSIVGGSGRAPSQRPVGVRSYARNDEHHGHPRRAHRGSGFPLARRPLHRRPRPGRSAASHARPVTPRPRADHRDRRRGGPLVARRRRGPHRRRDRPRARAAVRRGQQGDGAAVPRDRCRAVRRRAGRRRPHRGGLPGAGRRRSGRGRLRPAAGRRRPQGLGHRRGAAVPGGGHQHLQRVRPREGARSRSLRGLRCRRHPRDRQPAHRRGPAGDAGGLGRVGRGRAPHALVLHAGRPGLARRGGGLARDRRRAGPRDHARRRGRVRREDRRGPGVRARRLAGPPRRAPRALERDPLGEHDRDGAGPRPAPDDHDWRQPRGQGVGLPPRRPGRCGRLPAARRRAADVHADDGARRLRHREGRVAGAGAGHEHHVHRGLPRRGPSGGHRGDRAGDGSLRRRDRHGCGRGAPPQPAAARGVPAGHQGWGALRLRGVREGARRGAGGFGLRRSARRAGRPPRAWRCGAAGHRRLGVRRDHRRARRSARTRRSRCTPTVRSRCSPARHRTGKGTPPPGRCSPASTSTSRSRRSP